MNKNKLLMWLKDFKCTWLPQHILNDTHLIGLISNKLHELEQLVILENNQNENEILIETEHQRVKSCDTESIVLSTEQRSLPTPPDIHNQIDDEKEKCYRPAIRLKRISLAEAEQFLPPAWKTIKSKNDRKKGKKRSSINYTKRKKNKKNTQTNKILSLSTTQDETKK